MKTYSTVCFLRYYLNYQNASNFVIFILHKTEWVITKQESISLLLKLQSVFLFFSVHSYDLMLQSFSYNHYHDNVINVKRRRRSTTRWYAIFENKKNIEKIVYNCVEFHQWYQNNFKRCTCNYIAKSCTMKTKVAHL